VAALPFGGARISPIRQDWTTPVKNADGTSRTEKPHWSPAASFESSPTRQKWSRCAEGSRSLPCRRAPGKQRHGAETHRRQHQRVHRAVANASQKHNSEAWHVFDYMTQDAVILVPEKVVRLMNGRSRPRPLVIKYVTPLRVNVIISIRPTQVFYVIVNLSFKAHSKKLKRLRTCGCTKFTVPQRPHWTARRRKNEAEAKSTSFNSSPWSAFDRPMSGDTHEHANERHQFRRPGRNDPAVRHHRSLSTNDESTPQGGEPFDTTTPATTSKLNHSLVWWLTAMRIVNLSPGNCRL